MANAVNTALFGGNRGVDYAGVGLEYGDPGSLLTCFTKSDDAGGATQVGMLKITDRVYGVW